MPRPTTHRKSDGRRPFLTISLAPELNSQLRAEADKAGLAVSWIIEDLLKAHYAAAETNKAAAA